MTLTPGTRIGPYEIVEQIGVGGMGEVYRATDTNLKRAVAIKVLPALVAADPDRLARFQREAEVLAALNNPHIAQIHGLERAEGVTALVMELVEGTTLADRIAAGALPLDEALPVAQQIVEALAAAHEQGIVHRDLKPANVKMRPDGTVKVLDFGLAKAIDPAEPAVGSASQLPTITTPAMTRLGMILGTAAYMSPEQAKGRQVDKRADIWAFGAVLYEMLTGQRAFDGEDIADVLGAVTRLEPDWTRLPPDVSAALRVLLQRCLVKDPRQRVADLSTARFVLAELGTLTVERSHAVGPAPGAASRSRWQKAWPVAAAALTAIVVGAGAWILRAPAPTPVVAKFPITLPEGQVIAPLNRQAVAISPDGTRIAYVSNRRLYIRAVGELEPRVVPGTETVGLGIVQPMFSPDGQSLAFFAVGEGGGPGIGSSLLKRVSVSGGAASTLAQTAGQPQGATWGPDGILFAQFRVGVLRVSPNGGTPQTIIGVEQDEVAFGPQLLPDGKTVLFTVANGTTTAAAWATAQVVVQSVSGGARRVLVDGSDGRYLSSGHLVYAVGGTVMAVRFEPDTLETRGTPVPVVVGVRRSANGQTGTAHMAISENGTLVYLTGPATVSADTRRLIVGNGQIEPEVLKVSPGSYTHPRVSPDGKLLAVARSDGVGVSDIWTYDMSGTSEMRRLTFGGQSHDPVWSADSRRVTFQSTRDAAAGIFWQAADGSGAPERLTASAQGEEHVPESWSRDGARLLFSRLKDSEYVLWVFTRDGGKIEPFGQVTSAERLSATFSPDGRWVAYASTGQAGGLVSPDRGVFVEPFPATGEKHQAPKRRLDFHPVWSPEGRRLFYVPAAADPTVSVEVRMRPSIAFGTPVELPRHPRPRVTSSGVRGYDVFPDGRFVSLGSLPGEGAADQQFNQLRVVLNWTEELKQLVPAAP